jgi:hypothetical protein
MRATAVFSAHTDRGSLVVTVYDGGLVELKGDGARFGELMVFELGDPAGLRIVEAVCGAFTRVADIADESER